MNLGSNPGFLTSSAHRVRGWLRTDLKAFSGIIGRKTEEASRLTEYLKYPYVPLHLPLKSLLFSASCCLAQLGVRHSIWDLDSLVQTPDFGLILNLARPSLSPFNRVCLCLGILSEYNQQSLELLGVRLLSYPHCGPIDMTRQEQKLQKKL